MGDWEPQKKEKLVITPQSWWRNCRLRDNKNTFKHGGKYLLEPGGSEIRKEAWKWEIAGLLSTDFKDTSGRIDDWRREIQVPREWHVFFKNEKNWKK